MALEGMRKATCVLVTMGPIPKDMNRVPHRGANSNGHMNFRLTKPAVMRSSVSEAEIIAYYSCSPQGAVILSNTKNAPNQRKGVCPLAPFPALRITLHILSQPRSASNNICCAVRTLPPVFSPPAPPPLPRLCANTTAPRARK